jgi:hypothetical protein
MEVTTIRTTNPQEDDTARTVVEVTGSVLQYRFGAAQTIRKPLTLYFFWNSLLDHEQSARAGEKRTLLEIITAAFYPKSPGDEILPKITGFRPPYMGWNGDHFFYYTLNTHKGQEIALRVQRSKEQEHVQLAGVRA